MRACPPTLAAASAKFAVEYIIWHPHVSTLIQPDYRANPTILPVQNSLTAVGRHLPLFLRPLLVIKAAHCACCSRASTRYRRAAAGVRTLPSSALGSRLRTGRPVLHCALKAQAVLAYHAAAGNIHSKPADCLVLISADQAAGGNAGRLPAAGELTGGPLQLPEGCCPTRGQPACAVLCPPCASQR